nr:retrotransposon protein, putative, unclassified [Tanacetum cinerariifolium]
TMKKLMEDILLLEETLKEEKSQEKVHSLMVLQVQKQMIMQVKVLMMMDSNLQVMMERSTNRVNVVGENISIELTFDPNIPALEDIGTFDFSNEDEDDDAVADMNNLDTTIQASPTPTTRIHKDRPLDQVIGDFHLATQTRNMLKNLEEHWSTQEEGIDYDEVFAPITRIEAIRLFLAYASFKDFVVYQMDVKSGFLYGKIEEEVYVCHPPAFEDPDFHDRVYKVKKAFIDYIKLLEHGFEQIVDFLSAHTLRFALTVNPTIYESCIEQFWSTAMTKTTNGESQIHARVDANERIITESSIRRDLRLADEDGVDCLPNSTIFENLELMGYEKLSQKHKAVYKERGDRLVRAATTTSSLEAEQDSGNIDKIQSKTTPNEASSSGTTSGGGPRGNTLQSDEDSMKLNEVMELYTNLQLRVLALENTKTTQALEIDSLKKRGRKIHNIDVDEDITLINDQDAAEMFNVTDLHGEEVFVEKYVDKEVNAAGKINAASIATTISAVTTITTEEVTLEKALAELKTSKPKTEGKDIMVEEPVKPKKKNQIRLDEEVALKLQTDFDEEEQRLARERAQKEQEVNSALIKEWNDNQKRRKFFAAKVAEEKRNKPPTSSTKKIMCTYLKNMKEKKLKNLKNKSFDYIQKMFNKGFKRVNTFEPISLELVEGSLKRVGEEIEQERSKKQKMYMVFNKMLKDFEREDLGDVYRLVKAKYGSTRPVEDLDLLLWDDLKTMFVPHVEDQGMIVGIKRHLNAVGIITAHIDVNTALMKLVLLMNFKKNNLSSYYCQYKEVNTAHVEVSDAQELQRNILIVCYY